ncbi:glycoside hydrolase family 2 protein [Kribbella sp.]|uniref:glycoside hydrolase family 2 protein n=1 Tax=Kribbella sp. TaxID=1871183 RepID=UPI002D48706E|nr:glycoside hydrolase family 2 protein [Kribbella sp.]HZX02867.1 glycoside hydrolase family 2 protein [Kribbella sp.]
MTTYTTALHDGWTLDVAEAAEPADPKVIGALPVPATVPGTVHTDLLAAGLIPDPYLDRNEIGLEWIGHTAWRYSTTFEVDSLPADRLDLVFDGLDTLATINLNGYEVSRTRNMHRRYRLPIADLVVAGPNTLTIEFESPWNPSERSAAAGVPEVFSSFTHLRKMACNFGWDWGPSLVTSGIWRDVRLESWSVARIASARPTITLAEGGASVRVDVDIERSAGEPLQVSAELAGARAAATVPAGETAAVLTLWVENPELWWPAQLGDQPLYELKVALGTDQPIDEQTQRVGFRSIVVDTDPDRDGIPFSFRVNGQDVPIRGVNWIPDDCFPHRVDRARIDRRLRQALGAHVNLVRVWGGGVYESDDFYAACDELGLLVWQDFLFACAPYPEDEPIFTEVEAEARDNVERLMGHPSLALWNGNNENWMGWTDWNWKERVQGRPWGGTYYLSVLPRIVSDVDPGTRYWAGSPYSGDPETYYNDPARGLMHVWDAWNERDYSAYRDYPARFVSEFGWQGPPAWRTLTDSVHDAPLLPDSPGTLHHQKASDGNGKLARGLAPHFPEPSGMDDWHFAMQLNQARAIRYGVEHFRSLQPLNRGTILWQLNDCWPVTSWAVVDGAERLKPAWYALRAAYEPRLLTIQPRADEVLLFAIDDRASGWAPYTTIRRLDVDGTVLATQTVTLPTDGLAAATAVLDPAIAKPADARREFVVAEADDGTRALWFFVEDKDFDYPAPNLVFAPTADGVRVTTDAFVRDLCILPDRLDADAEAQDMLITLLPGESAEIRGVRAEQLEYPVVRHANELARRSR